MKEWASGYRHWWPRSWETWFREPLFTFVVPIVLLALWSGGLYRPRRDRQIAGEVSAIWRSSVLAVAGVIVALFILANNIVVPTLNEPRLLLWGLELDDGRLQMLALAVLLPTMLSVHRAGFRLALRNIRRHGWNLRHAAVIGVGRSGRVMCRTLMRNSWTGIRPHYFISHNDENKATTCEGLPVLGGLKDLEHTLTHCKVDAVYVALPNSQASCLNQLLRRLERFTVDVRIVPDVNPRYVPERMAVHELDGVPVLSYRESPLQGAGGVVKRCMDVGGAFAGLVLFAPLMAAIAVLVRLSGPGPVIYKQRRVSLAGGSFNIYKFRTMADRGQEIEAKPSWTTRGDPRITPIGFWLRRTSLDELPQLVNVLRGDMSLVGPRPERPELVEEFRDERRAYLLRQHVKAGITGWAQVNGLRGDTSLSRRLRYDLDYVRRWSPWFDLRIIAMTMVKGFVHKNAH